MNFLLMVFFSLTLVQPKWAEAQCTTQDYSDPVKEPDWSCPGPDEGILVPKSYLLPSVALEQGASYQQTDHGPQIRLNYPALLMDKNRVIYLGTRIKALRRLRWLERHRNAELIRIEKKYMADRLQAQLKLERSRVKEASRQIDLANKWYRSWTFGLIVGVATTTAATLATVYATR